MVELTQLTANQLKIFHAQITVNFSRDCSKQPPAQFVANVKCHDVTWSVYPFTHPELAGAFAMFRFQRARGTSDLPPLPVMVLVQLLPFFVLFVLLELKGHFHTSGRASGLSYYVRATNNKF